MRSALTIAGLASLTWGCSNTTLSSFDVPPQVSILSPEEGQRFELGVLVELVGIATDGGSTESLDITWSSSLDGRLGGDPPDAEGTVYWPVSDLTSGEHIITLEAVDGSGQSATTAVGLQIGGATEPTEPTEPADPDAPTVLLTSPSDPSTALRDEVVSFVGTITDPQQPPETLSVSLSSSTDGILWEGTPSITGSVSFETDELTVGIHDVTLTAIDDDGHIASDAARIEILNDGRPFARIDAPTANTAALLGDTITFEGVIWDLEDDSIDLTYEWTSDLDGVLAQGFPDSAGYTAFATPTLSAGVHLITLTALDTDVQNAADSVLIEISDPAELDQDLDGYSPNDGDCDDLEAAVNPGALEVCDGLDNDCDGLVNQPFLDAYDGVRNDTHATATDLGEIDNEVVGVEIVNLAGLTLHDELDEDWFGWNADDDWYDNVNITVNLTLPATGSYVAELYWDDGGTLVLRDSQAGSGSLTLSAQGSANIFEEDEDDWVLRVFPGPGGWDPAACSGSYSVEIRS